MMGKARAEPRPSAGVTKFNSYIVTSGEKWAFSDSFFWFFPPRVHFSLPDDFFLTRNEGEKFVNGAKWIQGGKNTSEEQKKRVRKAGRPTFETRGRKCFIL
jgi:hypothetical protein